ncbi:MAG TPA: Hsp20/alpha crystallin family protein [Candidatus Acidoferrum sp.]|nr:Hsp20/alpha crystallin family protein [Candidatus Acidoferrum sp.]
MDNVTRRDAADTNSEHVLIAVPPIEAWIDKHKKEYRLSIAVPGMEQKDLQVSLQGNNLTVSGERKDSQQNRDVYYLQQEFSRRRLHRTIVLPEGVDTERLTAEYNNGVLEIRAPLRESALPRQIEVTNAQKSKGVSAT